MEKYENEINRLNEDKEFTEYISEEEDARKVKNTLIYNAKIEGESIGKKEEKIEIAKNLLKDGLSIDKVSKYTNLSKEKIEQLLD